MFDAIKTALFGPTAWTYTYRTQGVVMTRRVGLKIEQRPCTEAEMDEALALRAIH